MASNRRHFYTSVIRDSGCRARHAAANCTNDTTTNHSIQLNRIAVSFCCAIHQLFSETQMICSWSHIWIQYQPRQPDPPGLRAQTP